MLRKKVGFVSIAIALAMLATITAEAYAYGMWNFDSDYGDYIYIQAAVAGNWHMGKLYSPDAYIYVSILEDLPGDHVLVLYWRFQCMDCDGNQHVYFDTEDYPNIRYKGQTKRIEPPEPLPNCVYFIIASGRAGYDAVWDTRLVTASLPFL